MLIICVRFFFKKYSARLIRETEQNLAEKAGYLEMLKRGKEKGKEKGEGEKERKGS